MGRTMIRTRFFGFSSVSESGAPVIATDSVLAGRRVCVNMRSGLMINGNPPGTLEWQPCRRTSMSIGYS